jgi:hypothetical protein
MDHYIRALHDIVTRGRNANSYKFALWRALASVAPSTDTRHPKISKHDLAPLFLKYYWPLEVKYHVRQGIDPDKDPIVMVLIRQLLEKGIISSGETLREFEKRMPAEHKTLLAVIARRAFDDVIPRFHIVRGTPITPEIFTFTGMPGKAGDTIELTHGGRQFLIDYRRLVDYVAVSGWVRFTEGFTSAPKLHDKIDGSDLKKGSVFRWRGSLLVMQNGRCFYDDSHEMASPEVDHVLPWSFVLEDRTWNLVLACRKCNNHKRDKLTNMDAIERLCARNEQISKGHLQSSPKFIRDFAEWHSRDLSSHINGLYDQAVADKFPRWN